MDPDRVSTRTEFKQPSLPVGVEERVREVVPIILWDLEGFVLDAVVQILHKAKSGVTGLLREMGRICAVREMEVL